MTTCSACEHDLYKGNRGAHSPDCESRGLAPPARNARGQFVYRTATEQLFGGSPARLFDRVLVRPADGPEPELDAPRPALVVDIDADQDEPSFREFHLNPRAEDVYCAGELRHVDRIEDMAPGTWTRLPW